MGQAESNVTSGVKKQAGVSTQKLYKLVNLKGGGLLVDIMKRAVNNKQFAEIDHAIKTKANARKTSAESDSNVTLQTSRWSRFCTTKVVDATFP
jgi:hypothetical protein